MALHAIDPARLSGRRARPLTDGWRVLSVAPSRGLNTPAALDQAIGESGWQPASRLGTVAAIECDAGRWSLDGEARRFDADDWWYRLDFDADPADGPVWLRFDGLATLAEVWLDDRPLGRSENMFIASRCRVDPLLRAGGNRLTIRFASLDHALGARRARPRWRAPMIESQQLRWLRTTVLGRTPGWSPPCAPVGPWRDIWLESGGDPEFELRELRASLRDGAGQVELSGVWVDAEGGFGDAIQPARLALELTRDGRAWRGELTRGVTAGGEPAGGARPPATGSTTNAATDTATDTTTGQAGARWAGSLAIPSVMPWWPHTHGEPARYQARLIAEFDGGRRQSIGLPAIGFRTIDIERDAGGFGLRINGEPVFCRGACWTPLDPVSLAATPARIRQAVEQVRDAGMNMLRMPGTGVYEATAFFDACDELGVLVWQDLMFANMDYPFEDPGFAASVCAEVTQQARAWRGRPSLAVVCGNSEVEQQAAMWGAPRHAWQPAMFHQAIPAWLSANLPEVAYWPSSAHGGAFAHQPDVGTTSYYGVGAYLRPLEDARHAGPAFATESLAFANVPSQDTIARMPGGAGLRVTHPAWKARASRDLGAGWDFEDVRDHYLRICYGVDPVALRAVDHVRYLALSAAVTGDVMAGCFAQWRRAGSGCGGALVLMLRDLWAGAGWGLLDDVGRPKACWHLLARALRPRTVLLTDEGTGGLLAHLHNEAPTPFDAELELGVWRQGTSLANARRTLRVEARGRVALPLIAMLEHMMDLNHAYRFGPLAHDAVSVTLREAGADRVVARAMHFPAGPVLPADPGIGLGGDASPGADGRLAVTVHAAHLATGVRVEAAGYCPDDEYFHLLPGESREIVMTPTRSPAPFFRGVVSAFNAPAPVPVGGATAART